MNFPQAISSGFKRYVDFNGRSSRSEYWWWWLFEIIGAIAAVVLDAVAGTVVLFYLLFFLAILLPTFAVTVRRLHDIGKSGWSILIGSIPFVGGIILLIWYLQRGDEGENSFGVNPLQASAS